MSVRRAVLGDEAIVRDLRLRALADAPDAFDSTLEREVSMAPSDWSRRISNGATFLFEHAGGPKGIAAGVSYDGEPDAVLLLSMWVDPGFRGSGAAAALVGAVVAWAESEGAAEVVLHVGKANARARRFYERIGFRVVGEEFVSPGNRIVEVEMRLALGKK